MPARVVRQPGVLAFLEALRRGGHLPGFARGGVVGETGKITIRVSEMHKAIEENTRAIESQSDVIDGLGGAIDSLANTIGQNILNLGQTIAQAISSSCGGKSKARGGLIGGRGTGTSDSNLAWLSRGEHVMPARVVRQPGVLLFLEALRRSGGNLSRVLDGMGRFALGGLVPRPMSAFAAGGSVGGTSNVTIQFPGLPPVGGLRASSAVVDELRRTAALAQVRSGGRKPSRYS
jgi:hypothetical protein